MLLDRARLPALAEYAIAAVGFAAALMLAGVRHLPRRVGTAVAVAALLAGLAGPAAYSLDTAATPHTGSIPTAGPSTRRLRRIAPVAADGRQVVVPPVGRAAWPPTGAAPRAASAGC